MTPTQIADAVKKIHDVSSSASEIDNTVAKTQTVLPKNLISSGVKIKEFTTLAGATISAGDETKYTIVNEAFFGGTSYLKLLETEIGTSSSIMPNQWNNVILDYQTLRQLELYS